MKKILSLFTSFILIITGTILLVSCAKKPEPGYSAEARTITIYRARESGVVDGTFDTEVKKAIEAKFKADTGIEINLKVSLYNSEDLGTTVEKQWGQKKQDLDGVVHYIDEDGSVILKYVKDNTNVLNVKDLLNQYGTNILKKIRENDTERIAERSGYVPTGDSFSMNILPSVNNEHQYGIIVRKDFMQQLYDSGKIFQNPEDYDVLNDGYKNMKFSDFENLLYKMKDIEGMRYPLTAKAWDINRVLGPVFETDLYSTLYDTKTEKYVPAQFVDGTAELMNKMWTWAQAGVWEKESESMSDPTRLTYFVNGWTGAYITYPNITNLISATRTLKRTNPSAEYMMIAPLADEEGTVRGFQKANKSFYGLMLPYKANDSETLIKYIDWMYSDPANYELCLYGVKGTHWIDGGEVNVNGKTYSTWSYPANKTDEFNSKPPYSGMYCLLSNINVSNRIRGDYDFTERKWYSLCTDVFPAYKDNKAEGVWIKEAENGSKEANDGKILQNDFITNVRGFCWTGLGEKDMYTLINQHINYVTSKCPSYLKFLDDNIKASLRYFETELK